MTKPATTTAAATAASHQLWFTTPAGDQDRRPTLTREGVVAEALTAIAAHGVDGLSMRGLATRLGVVPAALYRHVRNKEQLHEFFRSLPPDRFPALVALGEHVWLDNRDERFTAGLDTLIGGLQAERRRRQRSRQPKR